MCSYSILILKHTFVPYKRVAENLFWTIQSGRARIFLQTDIARWVWLV